MSEASDDNVTRPARTGRRVADDDVEKPVVRRRRTAKEPTSAKTTRAKVNTARAKKAAAVAAAVAEEDVEELGDSAEPASDDPFSFGTAAEPLTRVTRRTRKTTQTAATVDVPVVPAAATAAATVLTTGADLPPPIKTSAFTRRRPAQKRRLLNPLDSDSEADDSTPNGDASAAPADSSPAGPVTHVERSTSFLRRPPKKIAPVS